MNVLSCNKISKFRPKITWKFHQNKLSFKFISHCSAWERCWMSLRFPFVIHWWFLWVIAFRLNHRTKSSSNWKKVEWSSVQEWEFIGTSSLKPKKREQNEKKKSLTPFGYLANVQNYLFLLFKRNKLDF